MRLALIIISLLAICMPAAAVDLFSNDVAFSKTVTLDLKGEALSDVAKVLSKAAGVNIRPSKDVADQKVTILVDNMPLRNVMNHLAKLFGWSWTVKADDDGVDTYIIYDPLRQQREADRQEALDNAWQTLGAKLDSLSYNAEDNAGFYKTLALQQFRSLSPELRKAYLSGMRICYSLATPNPAWRPSQLVMDEFSNAESQMQKPTYKGNEDWSPWTPDPTTPSDVMIELYSAIDANLIVARCKVVVGYTHPDSNSGSGSMGIYSVVCGSSRSAGTSAREGGLDLCDQEIDSPSETLQNTLPGKPADKLLSKKVSISSMELVDEGAIAEEKNGTCSATRTDLLAALHNRLGLQIFSDYYSSWVAFTDVQDTSVKQLIEEKLPGFAANCGWDGNLLYTRVKDVRTADAKEIPNRFLRPWQAVVKKQGYRGLEELAQAAAFLSGEQRQAISENCHYLKLGECNEVDDLGGRENAVLRFYGLLTSKQKSEIFSGGVGAMGLTMEQRNALAALLYSSNPTRVGVYNNDGLNMNEPQVVRGPLGTQAVTIQMTCSGSFVYLKPGDDIDSRVFELTVATTPEEALLAARNRLGSKADPQNVIAQNDIVYTMAVHYEGYNPAINQLVPEFSGTTRTSENSTYHRVKIKVPDRKKRAK
ncbi:hypothetical protein LLG46_08145 [bacterium]|nr:hypothetical protein [bacterium]